MLNLCYFTSLICFYRNIFLLLTLQDNRLQIFLFFQEQDCLTAVQRGLQEVVEVFSFLFSCKGDDKGASFIIFFLTT